jgi:hypothetical protein
VADEALRRSTLRLHYDFLQGMEEREGVKKQRPEQSEEEREEGSKLYCPSMAQAGPGGANLQYTSHSVPASQWLPGAAAARNKQTRVF